MYNQTLADRRRLRLNNLKISLPTKALAFGLAMLPLHAINASKASNQYAQVVNSNTLTVVAVKSPTTVFNDGQYLHGFGYDLMRNYAQSLNVQLNFQIVDSNATALKWVAKGKANLALTNADMSSIEKKDLMSFSASCGDFNVLQKNGLDADLNLVFKDAEDRLTQTASGFICQSKTNGAIQHLASFYNHNVVEEESWDTIEHDLQQRMPIYRASFERAAEQYNLNWHMLAAMGYQESYLKPDSVSPTGVRGLMMLTSGTAKAMGIENRTDPEQSIQGGAKYYELLLSKYEYIPNPDRHWYALVAYNMGPGAVRQIQKQLTKQGEDPNNWLNMYAYLQQHQASNSRYRQALQYVTRIRAYLEHIQSQQMIDI
ncbi:transglycosylase SLT domain-containing protein [Acinetobacter sp. MB5]|uniref:transglycosylase SLT domain-containing protein n=1 Tax=Acinetobacter sp. MB5 TaxID=2069438 RepID=UPI000DD0BF31|nr:transglycosylase SLT domain-containing protein [Acinetobacter sp. MB5]